MNYVGERGINQNKQPDSFAFSLLCIYLALFLVGSHIFNEVVLVLFGVMILAALVSHRVLRIDRNVLPLILIIIYAFISIIWSGDKSYAFSEALSMLKCFGITWAIVTMCNSRKRITQVLLFFVIGCILLDIYAVYRVGFSGLSQLAEEEMRLGSGTLSINGNEVAHNSAIGAIIIMFLVEEYKNNKLFILLLPVVSIALLTGSRGGLIVLAFGLFISIFLYNRQHKFWRIISISLLILALLYVASSYGLFGTAIKRFTSMIETLSGVGHKEGSTTMRIGLITLGFQLFKKNPIFGYGCGQFKNLSLQNIGVAMSPHNTYIQILVSFGLIGFLLWYGTYFKIIKSAIKRRKDNLAILIIIMCLGWMLCDVLSHTLIKKTTYFIFGVGLSFLNLRFEESDL